MLFLTPSPTPKEIFSHEDTKNTGTLEARDVIFS